MTDLLAPTAHRSSCCGPAAGPAAPAGAARVAIAGNPNAGKTTLFNALTGLRAKTSNFPGTTLEIRRGPMRSRPDDAPIELIDLPGLYSLRAAAAEERVALDSLLGLRPGHTGPDAIVLLLDATNLVRNLFLTSQALELGLPTVVALTMMDVGENRGMRIDLDRLARELGCPVVAVTAKTGRGVDALARAIRAAVAAPEVSRPTPAALPPCGPEGDLYRYDWAEGVGQRTTLDPGRADSARTEALDRMLTHPVWGLVSYLAVMVVVFYLIFAVALAPMDWIDAGVGLVSDLVGRNLPAGALRSLLQDGVINGVGGVLVFLPQICLIFFCITIMEDLGYMARAALVMDRLMRRVGLPGKAFVPMLSAHACAIPGIMATRVIDNKRDRLVTILILPLLTCSARLPVYAMVAALLFPTDPLKTALVFMGAYGLGLTMAIVMAMVFRRTILPGRTESLVIELPDFHRPSLKLALATTWDRARVFLRKAGTTILALSIVLWWLSSYPRLDAAELPPAAAAQIAQLRAQSADVQADALLSQQAMAYSFAGRLGHAIAPAIRPLGFDWRIGVGVLTSFAAREVIVSTLAILYGVGGGGGDNALYARMRAATHPDGRPVFSLATCLSLLVFFVLAMQCLPTQVVTKRETGQWRWPLLQLGYMTALAYTAALVTYQTLSALGMG